MNFLSFIIASSVISILNSVSSCNRSATEKVIILGTTDIHGVILPYDYVQRHEINPSLANAATYIRKLREDEDAVFLLDNGDILQGQPLVYYYNYIDTSSVHIVSEALNLLEYDVQTAGSHCENIAQADVTFFSKKISGRRKKRLSGKIIDVSTFNADKEFTESFDREDALIKKYVNKVIGTSTSTFSTRDSYFGSSAFVDMLHSAQLEITGADISFAAPLSFDVRIDKGPVTVSDMFKLYRFENFLYTIKMKGEEVRKYLEFSYSSWLNTMKDPEDYLLKYRLGKDGKPFMTNGRAWLRNPSYDFDSAAGIDYLVDVSKPQGERVIIKSFSDGSPFENNKMYKIAVNSHRGNGGGRHLTEGAGIKKEELQSRLVHSTTKDLRYYIMKSTEEKKVIEANPLNNWKVIPEDWVKNAALREYKLLFGESAGANE